jgi:hypothetical protein
MFVLAPLKLRRLVDLLLLVDAELAGAAVDEQQEATNDGEDLEEVVLGEVLVGVVLVKLRETSQRLAYMLQPERGNLQSRSC